MELKCAYCKGKGKDPFQIPSKLSSCQTCGGSGKVRVKEPVEKCIPCKGKGIFIHRRLPCTVCGGRGSVSKLKGERCKSCEGRGLTVESDLPCSSCYGLGTIDMKRTKK